MKNFKRLAFNCLALFLAGAAMMAGVITMEYVWPKPPQAVNVTVTGEVCE